jgi:hypothetical protein
MSLTLTQVKNNQTTTTDLTKIKDFQELSSILKDIQPTDNRTAQLTTYLLLGTAITGIFVYHYIKNQET